MQALAASCEELRARIGNPPLPWRGRLALVSICEIDVTSFSEDVRDVKYLNGYVTNPNPTPTLTPTPNSNQINEKIRKETTLEIDQIT
jgi:hypothetical protein